MADYAIETHRYMSEPVETIGPNDSLTRAHARLAELGVSSLAVTDHDAIVGVISRTDLLRVGRHESREGLRETLLVLPEREVATAMTHAVVCVAPDTTLTVAAEEMVSNGYHRVYVSDGGALVGVLSTRDLMAAVRDQRDASLLGQHMSSPLFSYDAHESVAGAAELLEGAGISGVIIVEDEWPVGVYTQREALSWPDLDADTPVEEAMNQLFICMPVSSRMHRVAGQALAMKTRRVIATDRRDAVGILTGLDFARCVAR